MENCILRYFENFYKILQQKKKNYTEFFQQFLWNFTKKRHFHGSLSENFCGQKQFSTEFLREFQQHFFYKNKFLRKLRKYSWRIPVAISFNKFRQSIVKNLINIVFLNFNNKLNVNTIFKYELRIYF